MADNRIAYGLAKKHGIDTKGMSPKEVWEALKGKGITPESVDKQEKEKKKQLDKKYNDDLKSPNVPEKAYGFANKERKNTAHHKAHAKEMGFKNQDEYKQEACRFFNSNEGELYYSERRKRFYRYDKKKKRLVTSSSGIIHTFMELTDKKFKDKIKEDKLWKI